MQCDYAMDQNIKMTLQQVQKSLVLQRDKSTHSDGRGKTRFHFNQSLGKY